METERQLKEAENIAKEKEKNQQENERLRQKIDETNARVDYLEVEQGSNLEAQAEIQRLKQKKKNIKQI